MSNSDILLGHTVDRVRADVAILIETGHLNYAEAQDFLARLPNTSTRSAAMPLPTRAVNAAPVAAPSLTRAKALWPYNEQRTEPDLSFSIGDIIEITEQTNDDWWKGRVNGREGLFPSNHVELLEAPPSLPMPAAEVAVARNIPPAPARGKKPYKAFGASLHGTDTPPAVGGTNSVGLQQAAGQEEKKNKYGALKNTMATSAAGGVGFGAGAAIGGGLVRAIF